jgi:2-polyprenyl-3-methyl-5-hydroxy-6-metoxy-1,4-benzoquinol methylase
LGLGADARSRHQKFEGFTPARVGYIFDFAFCIEVIEHVPMDDHVRFLRDLRRLSPVLFFSTPDKNKVPAEGVRTVSDWTRVIREAGFTDVSVDMSRWTYLYRCKT